MHRFLKRPDSQSSGSGQRDDLSRWKLLRTICLWPMTMLRGETELPQAGLSETNQFNRSTLMGGFLSAVCLCLCYIDSDSIQCSRVFFFFSSWRIFVRLFCTICDSICFLIIWLLLSDKLDCCFFLYWDSKSSFSFLVFLSIMALVFSSWEAQYLE